MLGIARHSAEPVCGTSTRQLSATAPTKRRMDSISRSNDGTDNALGELIQSWVSRSLQRSNHLLQNALTTRETASTRDVTRWRGNSILSCGRCHQSRRSSAASENLSRIATRSTAQRTASVGQQRFCSRGAECPPCLGHFLAEMACSWIGRSGRRASVAMLLECPPGQLRSLPGPCLRSSPMARSDDRNA